MPRQLVALLLLLLLERGAPFTRSAPRFTGGRPWCAVVSSSAADGASIDFADSSSIREGGSIYSAPELYDLAFSYRDFEAEVAFLLEAHARHSGKGARTATAGGGGRGGGGSSGGSSGGGASKMRVLELAAGPARHCLLSATKHGTAATALDCSAEMVAYGKGLAAAAASATAHGSGGGSDSPLLRYVQGDMRRFSLPEEGDAAVDSVWCLLGSAGHLLTNGDWVGMLSSAAAALAPGGTLILELPHPRETFRLEDVTADGWDVPEGDDNPLGIGLKGDQGGILGVQVMRSRETQRRRRVQGDSSFRCSLFFFFFFVSHSPLSESPPTPVGRPVGPGRRPLRPADAGAAGHGGAGAGAAGRHRAARARGRAAAGAGPPGA